MTDAKTRLTTPPTAEPVGMWLDGGGDPDFDQIDMMLYGAFGARAVYQSEIDELLSARPARYAAAPAAESTSGHVHVGAWCAKCVEHGIVEQVQRDAR